MRSQSTDRTWRSFVRYLGQGPWYRNPVLALVLFASVALLAHEAGLLTWIERLVSDVTLSLVPGDSPKFVLSVVIDDDLYDTEFGGRSPLDAKRPDGLSVLGAIIAHIAAAKPRVIVVDIDTAHEAFARLANDVDRALPEGVSPHVVWFRDWNTHADPQRPRGFLGQTGAQPECTEALDCGVGSLLVDSDGMVRHYMRHLRAGARDELGYASLGWRAVEVYCERDSGPGCDRVRAEAHDAGARFEQPLLVFPRSPLAAVLGRHGLLRSGAIRPATVMARDLSVGDWWFPYAKDRVVVLGGTFEAARDLHRTAFGEISGMALWAASIENELRGPVTDYHPLTLLGLDVLVGLGLLWLVWRYDWRAGTWQNLAVNSLVFVMLWAAAFWMVNNYGLLVGFVPIAAGLWLHQLMDFVADGRARERELDACRAALGKIERASSRPRS